MKTQYYHQEINKNTTLSSELQSMDNILWAAKLGAAEDMSKLGTAYSMVNFWYEQGKF